ncbi:L-alanine-DL-glutamate epimerase-like enolase superfamily enzyme [Streptomyces sp. SAI-208]|uniref:enolase C-terminal domain-like protein n=1 Tax=unclassified Streptomyces TaxID=2593676 RepID=UPI002473302D|nr:MULTISPECIES: enolase C-terminal domain-like protein [unclassified Streptomyces]MDH6549750.1 L-alanine-DL-glutamate epimerase-like enolase superfamily enzyme [Streptomyces sp. SAI-041]MDH6608369.1 L-alanine-DL-glutamate epimerase-like enolase superfamily enzyme [Streptomyces sp. SAI-208]
MASEAGRARLYHVELPMRTPFDHPAARRRTSDSLVLSLTAGGVTGLGECAPRSYVTGETTASVRGALEQLDLGALFARLTGHPPEQTLESLHRDGFARVFGVDGGNNLLCLLETAVLDWLGRSLGAGAQDLLPPGPAAGAGTPATLPVSQVLDLSLDTEEFLATRGPFHFVKIKASDDVEHDARTVRTLRDKLGDDVPVMVDANMSWTPANAVGHAHRLREAGADYVEEPLPKGSWEALRALRRDGGLRVMLDESVCTARDARRAVESGSCDAFNIRVSKNGGPLPAAALVAYARENGIRFQFGVQVAEVGPLINAGRALAFARPDALTVEAGQSDRFFPQMIVAPPPAVDRDTNTLRPAGGTGWGMDLAGHAERWAVRDL